MLALLFALLQTFAPPLPAPTLPDLGGSAVVTTGPPPPQPLEISNGMVRSRP